MKKIDISTKKHPNTFALVSDELEYVLNKWKWQCSKDGYAVRGTRARGKYKNVFMHQVVAYIKFGYIPDGYTPDHKNGNRLDNTWSNIRLATPTQNAQNKRGSKDSTSRFKGVSFKKERNKWHAGIRVNGKSKHLGYRDTEEECAALYDKAAKENFGEFARLNF